MLEQKIGRQEISVNNMVYSINTINEKGHLKAEISGPGVDKRARRFASLKKGLDFAWNDLSLKVMKLLNTIGGNADHDSNTSEDKGFTLTDILQKVAENKVLFLSLKPGWNSATVTAYILIIRRRIIPHLPDAKYLHMNVDEIPIGIWVSANDKARKEYIDSHGVDYSDAIRPLYILCMMFMVGRYHRWNQKNVLHPLYSRGVKRFHPTTDAEYKLENARKKSDERHTLTQEEELRFVEHLCRLITKGNTLAFAALLILNLGFRPIELCGFNHEDIMWRGSLGTFRIRMIHKPRKDGEREIDGKTKNAPRVLSFSKLISAAYNVLLAWHKEHNIIIDDNTPLIYNPKKPFARYKGSDEISKGIKKFLDDTGITIDCSDDEEELGEKLTPSMRRAYVLRHSFCTAMLAFELPLDSLTKFMGHSLKSCPGARNSEKNAHFYASDDYQRELLRSMNLREEDLFSGAEPWREWLGIDLKVNINPTDS